MKENPNIFGSYLYLIWKVVLYRFQNRKTKAQLQKQQNSETFGRSHSWINEMICWGNNSTTLISIESMELNYCKFSLSNRYCWPSFQATQAPLSHLTPLLSYILLLPLMWRRSKNPGSNCPPTMYLYLCIYFAIINSV